jgi:hypothetical protein
LGYGDLDVNRGDLIELTGRMRLPTAFDRDLAFADDPFDGVLLLD